MAGELIKREDVKVEDTWDLSGMYADSTAWNEDIERIEKIGDEIAARKDDFTKSAQNVYDVLSLVEKLFILNDKVSNYAMCISDQDTGNTKHQAMSAKADSVYAQSFEKISFIDPMLLEVSDEQIAEYYKQLPELVKYKSYIDESLRMRKYTLSPEMEKLMALSTEVRQASSNTFGLLNNADMTFPTVADDNGEDVALSHGRFVGMLQSSDRQVRSNTFKAYYSEYAKYVNTYASLYNGQVKSLIFNAKARGFESTLSAAVTVNNVSKEVYHNLIDAVNDNLDALHAYVSLRKRLLKVDELHMYDIYVPMLEDYTKDVSFTEAKETALKALKPLGEDYLKVIKEGFDNRWIDVYENKGKRSGAYETSAYGCHPYVLLNFDGKFDDMFTLVHEMGHAMHSYYSDGANEYFDSKYKIFVAEVASTTNELLLLDYLLKNSEDVAEKKYLLNHYLDMFKGTLFRQTQFAEYELTTNKMVEAGENLNADNLKSLYLELNKKYYGPDMISDDEIALEWARIPHFYYNFYVYQYATSLSASVAIVKRILTEGESAVKEYRRFLSSGCTKPPVELLKDMGVDLETKEPICAAISVMRDAIKQLEELCE